MGAGFKKDELKARAEEASQGENNCKLLFIAITLRFNQDNFHLFILVNVMGLT